MMQPTITKQRCIGYQRDGRGDLRSVYVSLWSDGKTTYSMTWTNASGYEISGPHTTERPRIDIPQEPRP